MPTIKVTTLSDENLKVYTSLTQAQLRNRLEPEKGIFIAESPKVIGTALDCGYEPISMLTEERHINGDAREVIERSGDIPVYTADRELLSSLTGYELTRGVLCAFRRPLPKAPEEVTKDASRIAVLEDIADSTNIGAIFRSAAALGIDAVLITPSCCDPLCRRAIRVSMGTVFQIPWAQIGEDYSDWHTHSAELIRNLGFKSAAMALSDDSISVDNPVLKSEPRLALVLGTEGDGLAKHTIATCDYTVKIPMQNGVDSLNVASAAALAFWETRSMRNS
ncbi:MAG: RNA methyltransferase [Oscillospiraceae bacterium]|nr:RNA methyltransferase [Oscillospiraceae bacterium]